MANLSNINNKFIVDDGGNVLVGSTANLSTYTGISLYGANPSLAIKTSSASGWIWTQYVNSSGTNNFSMGVNQSVPYWGVKVGAGMDTPHLAVDASGNVGISTIAPSSPASVGTFLEIRGRNGIGGGTAGIVLKDYDNDAWDMWSSGGTFNARYNNSGTSDGFGISSGGDAVFYTSTNQGGLAASSATDNTTVRIINTSTGGQAWRLQSTGGTSGLGQGKLFIKVAGTETAANLISFVAPAGANINMGIGTNTPESKLAVKGTSGDADLFSISDVGVPTSGAEYGVAMIKTASTEFALNVTSYSLTGKGVRIYNNGADAARTSFEVLQGAGSRFIVDGIGNVGIGTTSPDELLHIYKSTAGNATIKVEATSGGDPTLIFTNVSANRSANISFQDNGINAGSIQYHHNGDNLDFYTAGTGASHLELSLNETAGAVFRTKVGIGVTAPVARVDAKSTYDYNVTDNGVKAGRVQYSWYTGQNFANTDAYVHIKTNLWMGGSPAGNTAYIMGGFTAKAYSYAGSYGEGSCMFHNWSGSFHGLSVTNRGSWATFMQNPYVSTDGYCVIVLRHNYYSTPAIDWCQYYTGYPWREIAVTVTSTSANATGVY